MDEYQQYLLDENIVKDKNFLKNQIIPDIKWSFIASTKLVKNEFYKSSDVYEIFGVDIVLDKNFKVNIIEINASPMMVGTADKKTKILSNMLNGVFNIVFA